MRTVDWIDARISARNNLKTAAIFIRDENKTLPYMSLRLCTRRVAVIVRRTDRNTHILR